MFAATINLNHMRTVIIRKYNDVRAKKNRQASRSSGASATLPIIIIAPGPHVSIPAQHERMDISTLHRDRIFIQEIFKQDRSHHLCDVWILDSKLSS